MSTRRFVVLAAAMTLLAAAVRVRNALVFPPLLGYDGFGHFTYIWYLAETGEVPLPNAGWSFFHPPLYYALMAALWRALPGLDPFVRLSIGSVIMGVLSLTHAAASYLIVRRCFPGARVIHLLAPALMLFLPVHIYSAPFLGNEGLSAVLCSLALVAFMVTVDRPSVVRSVLLGLLLGLALLTKVSALSVAAGTLTALALQALRSERQGRALARLAVAVAVTGTVCGWYYARNVTIYGTPIKMSRDEFMVRHAEDYQTKGQRGLLEYVLFDPVILVRPQWPRGLPLSGVVPPTAVRSALRESVPTGVYANTWYEGFNWWVLPPVFGNELARRSGQILLALGVVPTLLIAAGFLAALREALRPGGDVVVRGMVLSFLGMLTIFVQHTRSAPMHLSVKATYLMPVTVLFSVWFAWGMSLLRDWRPRWLRWVALDVAVLAVVSSTVFSYGLLFPASRPLVDHPFVWGNIHGIVYYAAHDRVRARELFAAAAAEDSHLAFENLSALAFEDGEGLEALYLAKAAARLEPRQSFGTPEDQSRFDALMQAEYRNTVAVIAHDLNWQSDALEAARTAVLYDREFAEAHYNLGLLLLLEGRRADGERAVAWRAARLRQAARHLETAHTLDPGFRPAALVLAAAQVDLGDCVAAARTLAAAATERRERRYPATGEGIQHSAAIGRHKYIEPPPDVADPAGTLERCEREHPPA